METEVRVSVPEEAEMSVYVMGEVTVDRGVWIEEGE